MRCPDLEGNCSKLEEKQQRIDELKKTLRRCLSAGKSNLGGFIWDEIIEQLEK